MIRGNKRATSKTSAFVNESDACDKTKRDIDALRFKPALALLIIIISFVAAGLSILDDSHYYYRGLPSSIHPIISSFLPEEDVALEMDSSNRHRYHLVFSTDCSPYQHWQSYLVYYTAMKVRQPGHVTRIASGCDDEEAEAMMTWFQENVQPISTRFHLQLTPHFSGVKNLQGREVGDYKFFNKPFGLKYWMENSPQLRYDGNGGFPTTEDDIIILIDPDMTLLRPIVADFSDERETLIAEDRRAHLIGHKVEHGKPFAQTYGLGTQWQQFDLDKIAGPTSPAKNVSRFEGKLYYPVGPPILATVRDTYEIAKKWTEFVPLVHAEYPHLLAEMYAFCIAAAHIGLKFQLVNSLMVSDVESGPREGWPLVDKIPPNHVCEFAKHADHAVYAVPSVVHMCQRYSVGTEWFFGKRRIPHDVYNNCESPLFLEPPGDLAIQYNYFFPPDADEKKIMSKKKIARESFMLCHLTHLLNEAATMYKRTACAASSANLGKTKKIVDLFSPGERARQRHTMNEADEE